MKCVITRLPAVVAHRGPRQAGFTLIELMIALVVLSVGLFSIIHLQVVAVRGNAYAEEVDGATKLVHSVAEDLRTQVLGWMDFDGSPSNFAASFPDFVLVNPPPFQGTDIPMGGLYSVQNFAGRLIATGQTPGLALPINAEGFTQADPGTLDNARAIYRVHYTAHPVVTRPGLPATGDDIRFTVYVSWDNKEHGAQDQTRTWDEDLAGWYNPNTFFERHMVTATFYLTRKKVT